MHQERKEQIFKEARENKYDLLLTIARSEPDVLPLYILQFMSRESALHPRPIVRSMIDAIIQEGLPETLLANESGRNNSNCRALNHYLTDVLCGLLICKQEDKESKNLSMLLNTILRCLEEYDQHYYKFKNYNAGSHLFKYILYIEKKPHLIVDIFECMNYRGVACSNYRRFLLDGLFIPDCQDDLLIPAFESKRFQECVFRLQNDQRNNLQRTIGEYAYIGRVKCLERESHYCLVKAVLEDRIPKDIIEYIIQKYICF